MLSIQYAPQDLNTKASKVCKITKNVFRNMCTLNLNRAFHYCTSWTLVKKIFTLMFSVSKGNKMDFIYNVWSLLLLRPKTGYMKAL